MQAELEQVVAESGQCHTVWHCALHGMVSSCPFKFMSCDEPVSLADRLPLRGLALLHQLGYKYDEDSSEW